MKKVLIVIIGLLAVYLILCIAGPKETVFTRSIVINADQQKVMSALSDFKYYTANWSPWTEKDPQMKMTFEGEAGKPGHKYSWEGNDKVGKGSQEIAAITSDSIYQKLNLITWHAEPDVYLTAKPEGNGTKVSWTIIMKNGFFGRGMSLFMSMEKMMAPDFEHGLDKLKTAVESMPAAPTSANYEVKEVEWPERNFIGTKKQRITMDKVGAFFGENLNKVMTEMKKNKIEPISPASGLYYDFKNEDMSADVVACFAAPKGAKVKGLENYEFPAGKAVMLEYHGDYKNMMPAHDAIKNYMKEKNLSAVTTLEEYVTDPMTEKDSTKWVTNIYYILAPSK
jgi:effector-binding domain-containing protein